MSMTPREKAALDRYLTKGPPGSEEDEYCEDGNCGACPGCLRAQDEDDRADWEYERKRDKKLEDR
jgi:hypothetical protein